MIKLIGILVVAVGFAFRVNALLTVVLAAVVTGLAAGFPFHEVVSLIGQLFVDNRFIVLAVILMLPVVGLLERHGLQEHVAALMRRMPAATAGRVLWFYHAIRGLTSTLGLSIGNHASMVRPLVAPMAEGAARLDAAPGEVRGPRALVRAHAAASENLGNFFSDDIFVAVGALLLIERFFANVGVAVSLADIKLWSLPTALWVLLVGWWRYRALDRRLQGDAAEAKATSVADPSR